MITFKQYLVETQRSVLDYFDPIELRKHSSLGYKSRTKLIMMPIQMFLQLAREGHRDESEQRVWSMIQNNEKFELPHLQLNTHSDPNVAKVEDYGHEGRHRARALQKLGYTTMPVLLIASTIRWSEQDDPNKFDYDKQWPQFIESEVGNKLLPFPVKQHEAGQDFKG